MAARCARFAVLLRCRAFPSHSERIDSLLAGERERFLSIRGCATWSCVLQNLVVRCSCCAGLLLAPLGRLLRPLWPAAASARLLGLFHRAECGPRTRSKLRDAARSNRRVKCQFGNRVSPVTMNVLNYHWRVLRFVWAGELHFNCFLGVPLFLGSRRPLGATVDTNVPPFLRPGPLALRNAQNKRIWDALCAADCASSSPGDGARQKQGPISLESTNEPLDRF